MSEFVYTYSKIKFYPTKPKVEDIYIGDIAHSLSLIARANGHCKYFYSVAQHSINCYREAVARNYSNKVQLACLLHDASEAYLSDIIRPVKKNLPDYLTIEKNLQDTIYKRFIKESLTEDDFKKVSEIDDCLLYYEFIELMDIKLEKYKNEKFSDFDFRKRDFEEVEKEFLNIIEEHGCL